MGKLFCSFALNPIFLLFLICWIHGVHPQESPSQSPTSQSGSASPTSPSLSMSPASPGTSASPTSPSPSAPPASPSGSASPTSPSLSMSPASPGTSASPTSPSPSAPPASPSGSASPASPSPSAPPASPSGSASPTSPSLSVSPASPGTSASPASPSPSAPPASPSGSASPTSPSASQSASPIVSPSVSQSAGQSASPNVSPSVSQSASQSASPKVSPSVSQSAIQSTSPNTSPSPIQSASPSVSPIASPSPSPNPSPSPSPIVPSPSPSPVNQNSFSTATNPTTPITAFGGTPVAGQGVAKAIDGTTTPYSNLGGAGSGFSVTLPTPVALTALRIYTSNESASQDPSSYELYGSNDNSVAVSSRRTNVSAAWVLVASGNVTLPAARNAPGLQVSTALNFLLVQFTNTQAFTNYLVVFPTLAGSGTSRAGVTTMSAGEVELLRGSTSGNDSSGLLGLLGLLVLPVIIIAALAWYVLKHHESRAEEWPAQDPFPAAGNGFNGWYPPAVSSPLPLPTPMAGNVPSQSPYLASQYVYPVLNTSTFLTGSMTPFETGRTVTGDGFGLPEPVQISYPVWGSVPATPGGLGRLDTQFSLPDPVAVSSRSLPEVYSSSPWGRQHPATADLYSSRTDPYSWSSPVKPTAPQFEPWSIPHSGLGERIPAPLPADTEVEW